MIGELDLFQREHEQKMKKKQRQRQNSHELHPNSHDVIRTINDSDTNKMTTSSPIAVNTRDIHDDFESSTISGNDRAIAANNASQSSEMAYRCDVVDGLNDLTDCQATTLSLKSNLSTTECPLVMEGNKNNSSISSSGRSSYYNSVNNSSNAAEGSKAAVSCIELIPDSYNVSDDYVKEYSEIVVLRRKGSQNDVNSVGSMNEHSSAHPVITRAPNADSSDVKRASSFRCSSFAKTNSNDSSDLSLMQKCGQSIGSVHSQASTEMPVCNSDYAASQTLLRKPVITPRPASLSGLFICFCSVFCFYFSIIFFAFSVLYHFKRSHY